MARFLLNMHVDRVSGSIGPLSFTSKFRAGVVRIKAGNKKARTPRQRTATMQAASASSLWRTMTGAQRQAWIDLAAELQYFSNPDLIGAQSGWAVFSGHARRHLVAGLAVPLAAGTIPSFIPDPPWLKIFPKPTLGQFGIFADPTNTQPAPAVERYLMYAGNARRAARVAYRPDERYRKNWTVATLPSVFAPETYTLASDVPMIAGDWVNFRAVTISDAGYTSKTYGWTVPTIPTGRALAAIAWVTNVLIPDAGLELTPTGILRVWGFDYPSGAPATMNLTTPSTKTVGDVVSFIAGEFPFETMTLDAAKLARPWTELTPFAKQHWTAKKLPLMLFTNS